VVKGLSFARPASLEAPNWACCLKKPGSPYFNLSAPVKATSSTGLTPENWSKAEGAAASAAVIPISFISASSSVANLVPPAIIAFCKAG